MQLWQMSDFFFISHKQVLYLHTNSFTRIIFIFHVSFQHLFFLPFIYHISCPFQLCLFLCLFKLFSYECFLSCIFPQCMVNFLSQGIFAFIFLILLVNFCESHFSVPQESTSSHAYLKVVKFNAEKMCLSEVGPCPFYQGGH